MADGRLNRGLSDHACQATGLVAAQAQCSVGEALARLRARAAAAGKSVEALAVDVLNRRVRFDE
jgi:hypothetical protein